MSIRAPGLTCSTCHGDLYPDEARRSDDGWRHAPSARGKCISNRTTRLHEQSRRARAEDLRWMAETGESFDGAAKRLGVTSMALERWFRLNPMPDVQRTLRSRNPIGNTSRRAA